METKVEIAILIPCYNEAISIGSVVTAFGKELPEAKIYVYDNNSRDDTASQALAAGAIVRTEKMQGKGNVVCRMFADIEADIYILVDGDGTYDASQARQMVNTMLSGPYDMINGKRVETGAENYRAGHRLGNAVLTGMVRHIFSRGFTDMLSGYKVFSRRYVKSFPALSSGFEIETQLTVHALDMKMAVAEIDTAYGSRPIGSTSKLNTWRDGMRILITILRLMKNERPFEFFCVIGVVLGLIAAVMFWPIFVAYTQTGLVLRVPTLIVITGMASCAVLSVFSGIILDAVTLAKHEKRRLHYLSIPALQTCSGDSLMH
ncbi:MAG: glycosyltransferase [Patescibacteria group bacterium]|jgi:glycosyltransferase involved in cell wall biosynthesis